MNAPINTKVLLDESGKPEYAVIPIDEYRRLVRQAEMGPTIPHEVVELTVESGFSPIRAWREHLGLTQNQVARRMGISQPTYARHERPEAKLRASTLKKVADAMGLVTEQLDV